MHRFWREESRDGDFLCVDFNAIDGEHGGQ
jgi:hypothetical protein